MNFPPETRTAPARRSLFTLLGNRRFGLFFATQFLGAFNDNLFKNALMVLLAFHATSWTTLAPAVLTNLDAVIFILPFLVFSASASQFADKFDKARLARLVKLLEMLTMGVAALGFFWHSLPLLLAALFLLGVHSTLFGPVKYAILPQHLREDELVGGNALVESETFVAILLGTIVGGVLAASDGPPDGIALGGFIVALAGFVTSLGIPSAPPPRPVLRINFDPFSETWRSLAYARRRRTAFLSMLCISWFWLYGALFLTQIPVFGKAVLGGGETAVTLLLATFTVGVGLGSLGCARLSGEQHGIGLIFFGALGLSVFGFDLFLASPAVPPTEAPLQTHSDSAHWARVIVVNNVFNALFMVVGALGAAVLLGRGVSIPALFAMAALGNAPVALFVRRRGRFAAPRRRAKRAA